jgi:hypothetical protein
MSEEHDFEHWPVRFESVTHRLAADGTPLVRFTVDVPADLVGARTIMLTLCAPNTTEDGRELGTIYFDS